MYWTINQKQEKRKPNNVNIDSESYYLYPQVFKNPVFDDNGFLKGEGISRKLKMMLELKLCISERENGMPKRKILFTHTLRYWEIIGSVFMIPQYYHYLIFIEQRLERELTEKFNSSELPQNETSKTIINKLERKLGPFIEAFKADYLMEYEFTWLAENQTVYEEGCAEMIKKQEKKQKRWEEEQEAKKKEKKDYQEKSKNQGRKWRDTNYTNPFGLAASENLERFEAEIIKAGFKALSKRYHPDAGGKTEDFQDLENAKANLLGK